MPKCTKKCKKCAKTNEFLQTQQSVGVHLMQFYVQNGTIGLCKPVRAIFLHFGGQFLANLRPKFRAFVSIEV